ncbi:hypothetical protein SAMN04488556_4225 [Halostagnicola kamekurae]|uniref:Helix-turn-helix domain-containing protein n=2 Tax=Halostagnicola kamekurae TaxID=619731 RepID=A0A1I6V0S1_9EURY|nr:hypothetical protein SAMN04488556_4225 [Halostagnicola kamekurae]
MKVTKDDTEVIESTELEEVSPMAWRLLRVAAGYEQREVERQVDDIMQAHLSMLENGTRGLSISRRSLIFDLYTTELDDEQVNAIINNF